MYVSMCRGHLIPDHGKKMIKNEPPIWDPKVTWRPKYLLVVPSKLHPGIRITDFSLYFFSWRIFYLVMKTDDSYNLPCGILGLLKKLPNYVVGK